MTFEQAVELRRDRLDGLQREVDTAIAAYQVALGENERAGNTEPSSNVVSCANAVLSRREAFHEAVAELQTFLGLPDDVLDEVASARRAPRDQRYWRADVEKAPTTCAAQKLDAQRFWRESKRMIRSWVSSGVGRS